MPKASLGPVEIYYQVVGTGDPVLFIGGLAADHTLWANQVAVLSKRHSVITYDPRDVGRSSQSQTHYTVATLANDAARLLEELRTGPAHVVGSSLGGSTAQELALDRPDLVRSLVLVSSAARVGKRLARLIDTWKVLRTRLTVEEFYRMMYLWLFSAEFFERYDVDRLLAKVVDSPYIQPVDAFLRQAEAGRFHDVAARLSSLTMPAMVVAGAEDPVTPPSLGAEMAGLIPGARLEVVPGAAHAVALERPREFNQLLLDFLPD